MVLFSNFNVLVEPRGWAIKLRSLVMKNLAVSRLFYTHTRPTRDNTLVQPLNFKIEEIKTETMKGLRFLMDIQCKVAPRSFLGSFQLS